MSLEKVWQLGLFLFLSIFSAKSWADQKADQRKENLRQLAKIFLQADAVHREFYRVTSGKSKAMMKSPFGKLSRALSSSSGESLTMKGQFSCDQYRVHSEPSAKIPRTLEVFEICDAKLGPVQIADIKQTSEFALNVRFKATNLSEVLGVGTLIAGKDFNCQLNLNSKKSLQSYLCEKWYEDKLGTEVYEFKNYHYEAEAAMTISADGAILKDLYPDRKIEVRVPKLGKILVKETLLQAPPEPNRKATETVKKPNSIGNSGQALGGAVLPDPEYNNLEGDSNGEKNEKSKKQKGIGQSKIQKSRDQKSGDQESSQEGNQENNYKGYQSGQEQPEEGSGEGNEGSQEKLEGGQGGIEIGPVTPRIREPREGRRINP